MASTTHGTLPDRSTFAASDVVADIWHNLDLPAQALEALHLPGHDGPALPSSFKLGILAQSTIALSALTAALFYSERTGSKKTVPRVQVSEQHAVTEFRSERLYTIDGKPPASSWGPIGGLHKTSDGYVRVHDSFPNHKNGTLKLLGLPLSASRDDVAAKILEWKSEDLEIQGTEKGSLAIYALRSYEQWDALEQSRAISDKPIILRPLATGTPSNLRATSINKCLDGLKVLEMSRVIAAPCAGRTLAAHGADVLWVTSPHLPDRPGVDRDLGRGKRTVQLDIHNGSDKERLLELVRTCDVFIQGYRPGSLASYGLSDDELVRINPNIVCANLSAFGPNGPWSHRRGFDSLVQTCSGMNVSEAEHAGKGEPARPTPCQALDHAAGYLLATGVMAALHRRAAVGGAWRVDVSLAVVMRYLRSLGQYPGATGFEAAGDKGVEDVPEEYFETKESGFGLMRAVRHSAVLEGCEVGWTEMPKPLGSDVPEWLHEE